MADSDVCSGEQTHCKDGARCHKEKLLNPAVCIIIMQSLLHVHLPAVCNVLWWTILADTPLQMATGIGCDGKVIAQLTKENMTILRPWLFDL